jgi:hypothetical protein
MIISYTTGTCSKWLMNSGIKQSVGSLNIIALMRQPMFLGFYSQVCLSVRAGSSSGELWAYYWAAQVSYVNTLAPLSFERWCCHLYHCTQGLRPTRYVVGGELRLEVSKNMAWNQSFAKVQCLSLCRNPPQKNNQSEWIKWLKQKNSS